MRAIVFFVSTNLVPSGHASYHRGFFLLAIFLMAASFAVLVMLPTILQRYDTRYAYQGIDIMGPDAETFYAARVQEVYDGFPNLGNVFYSSPKDQPAMQPSLPERSIAAIGRLIGIDGVSAFLLSKIILSFAVFLALMWLLYVITERPWVSLFSTVLVLAAGALLSAPWDIIKLLHPSDAAFDYLRFSRAVNPQWSSTFFFLDVALIALWIKKHKRLPLYFAALLSGTLVYSYVYAWTYFFTVMGLLSLWYLYLRDRRRVADLIVFWILIVFVTTPYLMHLTQLAHHPLYTESSKRFGMVLRHAPLILGVWSSVFIGLSLASRQFWPKTWPLLPVLALSGVIALNQHLMTGQYIVPHHYHWYFIQPLASLVACGFSLSLLSKFFHKTLRFFLSALLVVACVVFAGFQQYSAYRVAADLWGQLQQVAPVIRYTVKNLHAGQVVYSQDVDILNLVPIYGSADVYFSGNATLTLTSDERSRFAYFVDLWLQGLTPTDIARDFPTTRRYMLSSRLHAIYYREAVGDYAGIPDEEVAWNVNAYRDFYALPLHEKLTRYPLSAVLTTPRDPENAVWSRFLRCSTDVFSEQGYGLRMMIPAGQQGSCL